LLVPAYGAEALGTVLGIESCGHADAGPAANTREDAEVLLAFVLIGEDIADGARRCLELEQLLVDVVRVDALEIPLERPVARDATIGHQHAAPDRELLRLGLDDLAGACVPRDQSAHVAATRRGKQRKRCP